MKHFKQYGENKKNFLNDFAKRFDIKSKYFQKSVVDVGGGLGFLGKYLDDAKGTDYWVLENCEISEKDFICDETKFIGNIDFEKESFSEIHINGTKTIKTESFISIEPINLISNQFNAAFLLDISLFIKDPQNALIETKKLVKKDGEIYISFIDDNLSATYSKEKFVKILESLKLPIIDSFVWIEKEEQHYIWKCLNL